MNFTHFYFYNFPCSEDDLYTNIPQIVFFINIGIFNSDGVPKIPYMLTLVNAGYFFEEIKQTSAPLKSPLKIDFANFVFTGA